MYLRLPNIFCVYELFVNVCNSVACASRQCKVYNACFVSLYTHSLATCRLPESDCYRRVCALTGVALVDRVAGAATLFGQTLVQQQPVCLLVKVGGSDGVTVHIKASSEAMALAIRTVIMASM